MPMLDIFATDAFSVVNLTTAINKLPYVPNRLGAMNLFRRVPVMSDKLFIEEKRGKLTLVPTAARGTMPNVGSGPKRILRGFKVPFVPLNEAIMADDVNGIRSFGSEDQLDAVASLVNEKMTSMKQDIEVTKEFHRVGAITGTILDADGSTVIYDLFDEFDIEQNSEAWDFSDSGDPKQESLNVIRLIEAALGAATYTDIVAVCGNTFFDSLIAMEGVKHAYEIAWDLAFFKNQQAFVGGNMQGFSYGGITWYNYRGAIGDVKFIGDDDAHIFPIGVPDLFQEFNAPAPFMETVNTMGQPYYAKQEPMKWNVGVELHCNSSPLLMCTRPACLIKRTVD